GQNELDINECDAQIPHIVKNLRSPNEVRGNNRLTAVIEDTLYIRVISKRKKDEIISKKYAQRIYYSLCISDIKHFLQAFLLAL
ncbi:MAG: hypothetical protein J6A30_06245, partial [Ruminococcus sp.]|nr:hypothetical protein [Ruminococcus sp.]